MRRPSVWAQLVGASGAVVEGVDIEEDDDGAPLVVVRAHVAKRHRNRCGICAAKCPGYDAGSGRRRWRALDLGTTAAVIEAAAARVSCRVHGVVVAALPWARHGAGHTRDFDDAVAWMVVVMNKSSVADFFGIAWRTVGSIITRVEADFCASTDRLSGLRRIGIDEISYKRGHKYLTVVVDHDTGHLVWAAPGRDRKAVESFFDALGEERSAQLTHVSADAAEIIAAVVSRRAPQAVRVADPFHVVAWATDALDDVRRAVWNTARRTPGAPRTSQGTGRAAVPVTEVSRKLKNARYALWKNPEDLTVSQRAKLDWIAKTSPGLHRAYLLKEGLRYVFKVKGDEGKEALEKWLAWAARSRIPAFVMLGQRIRRYREPIEASLHSGLSNGLIESTNTKIRVLTRMAFGFKDPHALVALALLSLGGARPALPGR
ncbi:MAG: ISL3 family transposase [Quadrisphaera sp.]